jgi:TolA-binding protein
MQRIAAIAISALLLAAPASAHTQEEIGAMLLRIRDLEERVRLLTGENERLTYEVNQMRAELGRPPLQTAPVETGALTVQPTPGDLPAPGTAPDGQPPQGTLGTLSVSRDDPLIAPDGVEDGAPVDLSTLAGGVAGELFDPNAPAGAQPPAPVVPGTEVAGIPGTPAPMTALSGSARDEYDLAYGYVLTGDYALAEQPRRPTSGGCPVLAWREPSPAG